MCKKYSSWFENLDELKKHFIQRLNLLLVDSLESYNPDDRQRIRGNCNEIELILIELFGMHLKQIDLIEEKVRRSRRYYSLKYGGYCLTGPQDNLYFIKDGEIVDPYFRYVDNGIGDMKAVKAAYEFQKWIKESGITKIEWMLEAEIIEPAIFEVENYSFEEYLDEIGG